MKKYSGIEIAITAGYILVTAAVLAVTIAYLLCKVFVWKQSVNGFFFFPAFFLFLAEHFISAWWKDEKQCKRCTQYAVGKIVERKYVHTGKIAGYVPIVQFKANEQLVTVEINIINKEWGKSINCSVGGEYYLMYNETDPSDVIPCSSGAEMLMKLNKILTITFHSLFIISFPFLLSAFI